MKKVLTLLILSILFFILDNVFIPFLSVKNIYPSLVFVFIISYSIINGSWEGLWLGVFCGLLQDVYFLNGFGINAFTNMIICILAGIIGNSILKQKLLIPVALCFILSTLKGMLVLLILYIGGVHGNLQNILFISIYNMIIGIILYKITYGLSKKVYMQKRWRF